MALSQGQRSSSVMHERFLRKAVTLEIRSGRTLSQIKSAFVEDLRPKIEALYRELAFTCPRCDMPYLRKSDLTAHLRSHP